MNVTEAAVSCLNFGFIKPFRGYLNDLLLLLCVCGKSKVVPVYTMEAYRGSRGIAYLFLILALNGAVFGVTFTFAHWLS
jgi:hypothetical protein